VNKESADRVPGTAGAWKHNPILQVAKELKNQALEESVLRRIQSCFPNVDFLSASSRSEWFPQRRCFKRPIFALARTVGWISKWKEQINATLS